MYIQKYAQNRDKRHCSAWGRVQYFKDDIQVRICMIVWQLPHLGPRLYLETPNSVHWQQVSQILRRDPSIPNLSFGPMRSRPFASLPSPLRGHTVLYIPEFAGWKETRTNSLLLNKKWNVAWSVAVTWIFLAHYLRPRLWVSNPISKQRNDHGKQFVSIYRTIPAESSFEEMNFVAKPIATSAPRERYA